MKRRSLFKLTAGVAVLTGAAAALTRPARANAYYSGPKSDHFDGTRFFLPGGESPRGAGEFLRWQFGERAAAWPESFASPLPPDKPPARVAGRSLRVGFIGHASFLIQTGGVNILLDPHFSERASPLRFAGPKRANPPGIAFADLPKIDVVAVSHNHYDHLDLATLHRLWDRDQPRILTPLGNDTIIRDGRPDIRVQAHDWGERLELAPGVALTLEPSQHWSARGMFDRMHALWASFLIETGWGKVWFAGDTGFGDGRVFRAIREKHGPIRLGLLPIGAYAPRWFMRAQHINPAEAVEIFRLLELRHAIGYHWGTFKLTNEPVDEPPVQLLAALAQAGLAEQRFVAARPGLVFSGGRQAG